jgi:hypothetical protein
MRVVAPVAALIAAAFAWNAFSNAGRPPTPPVASSDRAISSQAAPAPAPVADETQPTATAETGPPPAPPSLAAEPTAPPPPKANLLLQDNRQPSSVARPSPRTAQATQAADSIKARTKHPRRDRSRRRSAEPSEAYRNPFDCKVRRNKPPCFNEADRQ